MVQFQSTTSGNKSVIFFFDDLLAFDLIPYPLSFVNIQPNSSDMIFKRVCQEDTFGFKSWPWLYGGWKVRGRCCAGWRQESGPGHLCRRSADAGWPAAPRTAGSLWLWLRSRSLEPGCWESRKTQTHRRTPAASPTPYWSSASQKQLIPPALSPHGRTRCTGLRWSLDAGTPVSRGSKLRDGKSTHIL